MTKQQPFAVERKLTPEHLRQFDALLGDRRTILDEAQSWLRQRGYRISRTAVGDYRQRLRSQSLYWHCRMPRFADDSAARAQLAALAERLAGDALASLVQFASFLLSISAANGSSTPAALSDLIAVRSAEAAGKGVSKVH